MFNLLCPICRESLCEENLTKICSLHCGHVFHDSCILAWLDRSQTCPNCRLPATRDNILKLFFEVLIEDNQDETTILRSELSRTQHILENVKTELRSKADNVNTLTKKLTDATKQHEAYKFEATMLNSRLTDATARLNQSEKRNRTMTSAVESLQRQVKKLTTHTRDLQKYQKMKKLLDGSVKDADETINSNILDMTTLKACFMTIKRDFTIALEAESKLKGDYSSLYSAFKKMEKDNAYMTEQLTIKDRIIESYKAELKNAPKRSLPADKSSGSSTGTTEKAPEEPNPKKRMVLPLRRSCREVSRPSAAQMLNKRSHMKSDLAYNGLGGHSKQEEFPNAKLKSCKIVSNRKNKP